MPVKILNRSLTKKTSSPGAHASLRAERETRINCAASKFKIEQRFYTAFQATLHAGGMRALPAMTFFPDKALLLFHYRNFFETGIVQTA